MKKLNQKMWCLRPANNIVFLTLLLFSYCSKSVLAIQKWTEQPRYQEVNPHGMVVMSCLIAHKKGECRWERDGDPVGIYPTKYEWSGNPEDGDCSLKILDSSLEFDDGVWQCQVTPTNFLQKDSLISEGAQLVVREKPNKIVIQRVGDSADNIIASAGEDLEMECIATGGNPSPTLRWYADDQEIRSGHTQENSRPSKKARTWTSISRLMLPVSKADDGATIRCEAEHPALQEALSARKLLTIHYPPYVITETTSLINLEEEKDSVTMKCMSESNPPSKVWWEKEGVNGVFSPDREITISPVTRSTAGTYKCVAQNALGLSEPGFVEVDVKFAPSIVSLGPSKYVSANVHNKTTLTCLAEGNPAPRYQWLQKLPTHEVLVRGYSQHLQIENVTYDHQGEFVCKAVNVINGEQRSVQSDPIIVEVTGAPQVTQFAAIKEVIVGNGEDAVLEVRFCADPLPEQLWHLGETGDNMILAAGSRHKRFVVNTVRKLKEDCYISTLRILDVEQADTTVYQLRLTNSHGTDMHEIRLVVREHLSPQMLIFVGVTVGIVLTILFMTMIILYCVKTQACCCRLDSSSKHKPSDVESDRTDVESTHSSNLSAHRDKMQAIIPPDALYGTVEKRPKFAYVDAADFNDSKESLKPDLLISNLNRTNSSSGDLNNRVSYNDLCFPKISNYGSMKKKKHCNVGVECKLGPASKNQQYG